MFQKAAWTMLPATNRVHDARNLGKLALLDKTTSAGGASIRLNGGS